MRSWIDFWDADHAIYVSDRHKELHAQRIAADITRHIPRPDAEVLDYGCGEALYAENVAARCRRLILSDAAPRICEALAQRLSSRPGVEVLAPAAVARLPDASLDLIVVNSLLQYLSRDELASLLELWRAKLKSTGRLVLADVIPPGVSPLTDAAALLGFAARGRFLGAALAGLVKTALSDYGRIRKQLGFSMYEEPELVGILAAHGLACQRVRPNFGHNQSRMTFEARPA